MKKTDARLFFADWALLFGTVYAALRCLQTAFGFPYEPTLWSWTLLLVGVFNLIFRMKRTWLWALGTAALAALIVWFCRRPLGDSFWQLTQATANHLSKGYHWLGEYVEPAELPEPQLLPALIAVAAALGFLLCASVVAMRAVLPGALWTAVAVTPCFFLTDTPPATSALLLLCACQLILIFSQRSRNDEAEETVNALRWALVPTALTIVLLMTFFPPKGYEPPVRIEQISAWVERVGGNIDREISGSRQSTQGISLRELGRKQEQRYTVMEVTVDGSYDGYLYLRGVAYESFDGKRWSLPDEIPEWSGSGSPLDAPDISDQTAEVRIRTTRTDNVLYTPCDTVSAGRETVYDYYVPNPQELRDYSFTMNVPTYAASTRTRSREELLRIQERAERDCLYLPETTRDGLLQLAADEGLIGVAHSTAVDVKGILAARVASYVSSRGVYSLEPERVPEGEDFCVWFLTEAEGGYCAHYAAAAAALYRAVGIPARYVEGYVTEAEGGKTVAVEQRQSHAWVEICLEGRWVLIDPTPAGGVAQTAAPAGRDDGPDAPERPAETDEPGTLPTRETQTEPGTEPSENPSQPTTAPTQLPEQEENGDAPGSGGFAWQRLLPAGALLLALAGLLILRAVRRRRFRRLRGNALALHFFRLYRQLCRVCRDEPSPELLALAQKARFSQHELSDAEIDRLRKAYLGRLRSTRRKARLRGLLHRLLHPECRGG